MKFFLYNLGNIAENYMIKNKIGRIKEQSLLRSGGFNSCTQAGSLNLKIKADF